MYLDRVSLYIPHVFQSTRPPLFSWKRRVQLFGRKLFYPETDPVQFNGDTHSSIKIRAMWENDTSFLKRIGNTHQFLHSQIGLFETNTFCFGHFFCSTHRFHYFGYQSKWISPVPAAAGAPHRSSARSLASCRGAPAAAGAGEIHLLWYPK